MTFADFCVRLEDLHVARIRGLKAPYKPLLVAAVVILIHKGKITSPSIWLDGGLRSVFKQLLARVFPDWPFKGDIHNPYRYLATDGIWDRVPAQAAFSRQGTSGASTATRGALRRLDCAVMSPPVFEALASSFENRFRVLQILWERYFPPHAVAELLRYLRLPEQSDGVVREAPVVYGADLTERALEEHLERRWDQTPFAQRGVVLADPDVDGLAGRQVLTPVNCIDLLGHDRSARQWWVFELKRGRPTDRVVGQVSRYLGWLKKEQETRGETVRGAIIARRADDKLRYAVDAHQDLSLWLFDDTLTVRAA